MGFAAALMTVMCLSVSLTIAEAQLDTMIRLFLGGKDLGGPGGVQAIEKSLNDILSKLMPGANTGTPGLGIMGIICKLQLPVITNLICGDDDSTPELPDPVETDPAPDFDLCTLEFIGPLLCSEESKPPTDDDETEPELPDPMETGPGNSMLLCKTLGINCPKDPKPKNPPKSTGAKDSDKLNQLLCKVGLRSDCEKAPVVPEEPVEAPMKQKSPLTGVLDTATSKMFSKIVEMIDNLLQPIYGIIDGIGSPLLSRDLINKLTSGLFGNRPSTTGSTKGGIELPFGLKFPFPGLDFGK